MTTPSSQTNGATDVLNASGRATNEALQNLLSELWRYRWLIPAVAVLVTALVTIYTLRLPKSYEAVATLEYDPNPARPLGRAVEDTGSSSSYWGNQEFFETQKQLLRSRSLAELVVRKLRLQDNPDFLGVAKEARARFKAVPVETAAAAVQGRLEVENVRDTRLVRLRVRDSDQDRAQLLANTIAETYIEKSLQDRLGSGTRALEWLSTQLEGLKKELEQSELALYRFREDNHSLSASLSERQKIIGSQLQTYNETLTELRTRKVQTEAKLSVLKEMLRIEGNESLAQVESSPLANDPLVVDVRNKYNAADATLQKLLVTYGNAHPLTLAARSELEALRAQMREQVGSIVRMTEASVRELDRAEQGIQQALDQVNQQGLELSLQEIDYTRLERERKSKTDLYNVVMNRAAETDLTHALRVANARVVDRAIRPTVPVSPKVRMLVALGLLLGLALGVAAALLAGQLDNKVRTVAQVEARGVTVLGVLPGVEGKNSEGPAYGQARSRRPRPALEDRDLVVHREPRSSIAECCRTIRTNITFQSADQPVTTLAVTSAMPRDGKTTVSVSLAITMAQSGRRVLLVDVDLRKPRLHRAFGLAQGMGVTSILAGEATLDQAAKTTEVPNLSLLQCGPLPPNPAELLHTKRFKALIEEARSKYDTIIFDTPPLAAVTDPAIVATQVDGTVLVVRSRKTARASVDAALRHLRSVNATVIGVVLNDVDLSNSPYGAYHAYYRGYYGEEPPASTGTGSASHASS